jgi:hypothetical protein
MVHAQEASRGPGRPAFPRNSEPDRQRLGQELARAEVAVNAARMADIRELRRCYDDVCTAYARCLQHMDTVPPISGEAELMKLWNGVGRIAAWIESVTPLVRDYAESGAAHDRPL